MPGLTDFHQPTQKHTHIVYWHTGRVSVCIERRAVSEPSSPTHSLLHLHSLLDISPFSSNHFLPFGLLFFLMQLSLIHPFLSLSFPSVLLYNVRRAASHCKMALFLLFPLLYLWCSGKQHCVYICQLYLPFLHVCSYLALSFVLIFSNQSPVSSVCDNKILINQYHSPNVITFFSEPLQYV